MGSLDENPNCANTFAGFRLVGDALDPDAVSRALRLEPKVARAKGQELPARRHGKGGRQRTGVWLLDSQDGVTSTSLERHLLYLLDALEPANAAIQTLLEDEPVKADFYCYWRSSTGQGGPEISPDTLARIAALNASLGIDFVGLFDESG